MAADEVLLVLVFTWFGIHISFPRQSQFSRFAGVVLAVTFVELVAWYAVTIGYGP